MSGLKLCEACGVPRRVARSFSWNPDGTITQRRGRDHRMVFMETEGFNVLFTNIEKLIGVSIEKIIVESKSRATRDFIEQLVRGPKGQMVRLIGLKRVIGVIQGQSLIMGYGVADVISVDWKKPSINYEITNPYSLPMMLGDLKGATEAVRRVAGSMDYGEKRPGTYWVHGYQAKFQEGIEERLVPKQIPRKPGDVTFKRCPRCGTPDELADFKWDLERGQVLQGATGLRFAFLGPVGLQVIFEELENELGDTIPDTIIEAQRMRAEEIIDKLSPIFQEALSKNALAFLGLGNLIEVKPVEGGYRARIENAALPPILVGTALALFESYSKKKAKADWSFSADGDLEYTVTTA